MFFSVKTILLPILSSCSDKRDDSHISFFDIESYLIDNFTAEERKKIEEPKESAE